MEMQRNGKMWPLRKAKPHEVKVIPPYDYSYQYISANTLERAFTAPPDTILVGAYNGVAYKDARTNNQYAVAKSIVRNGVVYPPYGFDEEALLVVLTRLKCMCYADPKNHPAILIPPPIEVQYICAGNEKLQRQVEDFIIAEFPDALTFPYLWRPEA